MGSTKGGRALKKFALNAPKVRGYKELPPKEGGTKNLYFKKNILHPPLVLSERFLIARNHIFFKQYLFDFHIPYICDNTRGRSKKLGGIFHGYPNPRGIIIAMFVK